jgi:hypothetical protein
MTRKKDHNSLLSTLEDIKKGAAEAAESAARTENQPAPASAAEVAKPAPAGSSSLLDALLSEVKAQADREVREVEKNLDHRVRSEREAREEEERKKKEAFEKQIQEEARRRMDLVKKKEQERLRKQEAVVQALADEKHKRDAERLAILRRKRLKKTLVGATIVSVVGTAAALVLFLVILPEINRPPSPGPGPLKLEQLEPRPHSPLTLPAVTLDDSGTAAAPGEDPAGSTSGIDGYGAEILRFVGGLQTTPPPPPSSARPVSLTALQAEGRLAFKVAEAFRVTVRVGGTGGSGGKDPDSFIGVDTSVFQDKKKK